MVGFAPAFFPAPVAPMNATVYRRGDRALNHAGGGYHFPRPIWPTTRR